MVRDMGLDESPYPPDVTLEAADGKLVHRVVVIRS